MTARTVKGSEFAILVDGKRIIVKHIYGKGKRCRIFAPDDVLIESTSDLIVEESDTLSTNPTIRPAEIANTRSDFPN